MVNWKSKLKIFKDSVFVYEKSDYDFMLKSGQYLDEFVDGQHRKEEMSEKEINFLLVAEGKREPQTDKEMLWSKFNRLMERVSVHEAKNAGRLAKLPEFVALSTKNLELKKENEELKRQVEKLQNHVNRLADKYEPVPIAKDPKTNICPICGGDGGVNSGCYKCKGSGLV